VNSDSINWRAVAAEYKRRLHAICSVTAMTFYAASGFGIAKLIEQLHLDSVTVENIAAFVWLPLGALAFYLKNRLEDWADRQLPSP
jgi:hypothetical protein